MMAERSHSVGAGDKIDKSCNADRNPQNHLQRVQARILGVRPTGVATPVLLGGVSYDFTTPTVASFTSTFK